jgi:polar amino acid transport system ATP-binding protein
MADAASTASAVEIRKVNKYYGPFHALKDIDMSIAPGKVTCLIGPSGSGKSTLLRCINFLEEYDSGEVRIDGQLIGYDTPGKKMSARRLREMRRGIGMVFQQFNLWPHMTALGNVAEGLIRVRGMARAARHHRALVRTASSATGSSTSGAPGKSANCRAAAAEITPTACDCRAKASVSMIEPVAITVRGRSSPRWSR